MNLIDSVVQFTKKHSPDILVGLGIGGVVTGTILACKATRKIDPIIEEHKAQMNAVHMAADMEVTGNGEPYTEKDKRADTAKTYAKTGLKLAKLYLPAGAVMSASVGCILGSHKILNKRNIGLTAAYTGLAQTFAEYRKNIVEKFGQDADTEARYSIKAKTKKDKDGNEETTYEKPADYALRASDHSRFFREKTSPDDMYGSRFWDASKTLRLSTLYSTKTNLNRKLLTRKSHTLSLNEVYDAYDLAPSADGNILGYIYRPGIDPVDENGIPMTIDPVIFCFDMRKNKQTKKTIDEAIDNSTAIIDEEETLIDFPNLVSIV